MVPINNKTKGYNVVGIQEILLQVTQLQFQKTKFHFHFDDTF